MLWKNILRNSRRRKKRQRLVPKNNKLSQRYRRIHSQRQEILVKAQTDTLMKTLNQCQKAKANLLDYLKHKTKRPPLTNPRTKLNTSINMPLAAKLVSAYVQKENRHTQTDLAHYQDKDKGGFTGLAREWTLTRHLEDAEHLIQINKDEKSDLRDDVIEMEQRLKKSEMDYRAAKREAANANATNDRMKE